MNTAEEEIRAKIFYYLRGKYYNSMQTICKEAIVKFKDDLRSFHLYKAMSLLLNNRIEESINELDVIKAENDAKLSVTIGLMYAHKLLKVSNRELFVKLDAQMREYRKMAEPIDFYHSGFVLFVLNKFDKALDYLDKALNAQSGLSQALSLKAWILLEMKRANQKNTPNVVEIFENALQENTKNIDAIIGLTECYLSENNFEAAFNTVNKAIVRYSTSSLPLIEKMKLQFAQQDWEQTIETMNRVVLTNPKNFEALKINILILLCRDANYSEAAASIKGFAQELDQKEPKNGKLRLEIAQLFSRICGKNPEILKETFEITEKAVQSDLENIEFIVELGYQCLLSGEIKEAAKYYKTATKIDSNSLNALLGLTTCEFLQNGKTDQIKNQLEFLTELSGAKEASNLFFILAKTADSTEDALNCLNHVSEIQLSSVKLVPYSDQYLRQFDPDFMLDVAKEYLKYTSNLSGSNKGVAKTNLESLGNAQKILAIITKACPALHEALYLLAKLQFLSGQTTNSMSTLEQLEQIDNSFTDAHLLMAQIQAQSGLYDRAAKSLEVGLSNNFKVRENPLYHYISGLVEKNTNNLQDAIKSLTTALSLINLASDKSSKMDLTIREKASIYIELIDLHTIIGQIDQASRLLDSVVAEFQGTAEEARILILSADNAVKRKNIQTAIDLLSKVKSSESYYLQAKTKLAEILLEYRMDRYAYLQCYQEMVDENPGSDSYILLGDAYMNILEPDDALEAYNLALQQNPTDPYLISKMGQAYVETHYFAKAVAFYKDALKLNESIELKLQLADLYILLKDYRQAELLLSNEIEMESNKNLDDLTYLQQKTKLLNLLAQIQEKSGNIKTALSTLKDARDNQNRVKKRFAIEQKDFAKDEEKLLIEIGIKLAETSSQLSDNEQAIHFYKDCLEIVPNDITVLTALAKLYMQMNYLENCQLTCTNILKIDQENEAASVLMADIAFRKIDFDMALFHFTQLIIKQPTNWTALVRLVEIMRRTGNLDSAPEYLNNAGQTSTTKEAGLFYSTALYQWYLGNLNSALRNFNAARQDPEWGLQSMYNMIEICLNPDDNMFGDQFMDNDDTEYRDSRSMALKTADRLLREVKQRLDASGADLLRYRLLANFRLLASQEKSSIERGLEDFIAIASQANYKDHIGPILGMATAYTHLKQAQRAKNQLKRVVKSVWTFEDAEYLERCWLLLADYYIQSAKFDVASDLLNRVVQHNKACSKAYEYLGFICEKEQHYKDAVINYEAAWRFGGKSNPSVGFKLAFNFMKCKKYPDAIDMGYQVLKLNPDYPRVKKDILDKCINNLRT